LPMKQGVGRDEQYARANGQELTLNKQGVQGAHCAVRLGGARWSVRGHRRIRNVARPGHHPRGPLLPAPASWARSVGDQLSLRGHPHGQDDDPGRTSCPVLTARTVATSRCFGAHTATSPGRGSPGTARDTVHAARLRQQVANIRSHTHAALSTAGRQPLPITPHRSRNVTAARSSRRRCALQSERESQSSAPGAVHLKNYPSSTPNGNKGAPKKCQNKPNRKGEKCG